MTSRPTRKKKKFKRGALIEARQALKQKAKQSILFRQAGANT